MQRAKPRASEVFMSKGTVVRADRMCFEERSSRGDACVQWARRGCGTSTYLELSAARFASRCQGKERRRARNASAAGALLAPGSARTTEEPVNSKGQRSCFVFISRAESCVEAKQSLAGDRRERRRIESVVGGASATQRAARVCSQRQGQTQTEFDIGRLQRGSWCWHGLAGDEWRWQLLQRLTTRRLGLRDERYVPAAGTCLRQQWQPRGNGPPIGCTAAGSYRARAQARLEARREGERGEAVALWRGLWL